MTCGIYAIYNIETGQKYIGSSFNIEARFIAHDSLLSRNKHPNSYLQNTYNKYGKSIFIYEILEECEKDVLLTLEQLYIHYNIVKKDYNLNPIAGKGPHLLGSKHHQAKIDEKTAEEIKIRLSQGESPNDLAKEYPLKRSSIVQLQIGKNWSHIRPDLNEQMKLVSRRGANHPETKLSEKQVREIKSLLSKLSDIKISKLFGVCPSTINCIRTNKTWKHIN